MQTTSFSSSRILLPVRPWFIFLSLLIALLLNFLPTRAWLWTPDWLALVIVFWSIREPRRVGMGWGFLLGLVMDVADASLLGQHALAYVLAAYGATTSMARQPEVQGRLFTVFILGSAFVEALALIGFVVALIVK